MQQHAISSYTRPNFAALFTPKLVTVLRKGYGAAELRRDAIAGLTVAIVALPLSMAIAIASGATPAQCLYTAIVGGFLVSALGGSRFQIGGPAGAFIVLVAATAAQHSMSGVILATFLSGHWKRHGLQHVRQARQHHKGTCKQLGHAKDKGTAPPQQQHNAKAQDTTRNSERYKLRYHRNSP